MAKQVDITYGNALFELAVEEGRIDELYEEVVVINSLLNENEELITLLNHPHIDKVEKQNIINNIFDGRVSKELTGIIAMVMEKGHISSIVDIFDYFISAVKKHKNIGVATVTSAADLSDDQKSKIEKRLVETTSFNTVEVTYKVDKSLIGGLVIRIDDRIVDSSIKTKLESLSKTLANA